MLESEKTNKKAVYDFWNKASCGENLYLESSSKQGFIKHSEVKYKLEPFILDFAKFNETKGKKVLEIGVGLGADHQKFAEAGAKLTGIDLTERAIKNAKKRLQLFGLESNLTVGDAEDLAFHQNSFDLVYSGGYYTILQIPKKLSMKSLGCLKKMESQEL
jgi:2-polyprenyl-3-methyl-5-hydroxy-6-metoxy-1,4-benzoquinol methylase